MSKCCNIVRTMLARHPQYQTERIILNEIGSALISKTAKRNSTAICAWCYRCFGNEMQFLHSFRKAFNSCFVNIVWKTVRCTSWNSTKFWNNHVKHKLPHYFSKVSKSPFKIIHRNYLCLSALCLIP